MARRRAPAGREDATLRPARKVSRATGAREGAAPTCNERPGAGPRDAARSNCIAVASCDNRPRRRPDEWPEAWVRRKGETARDMTKLLRMCTLVAALLCPPGARASVGFADRIAQKEVGFLNVASNPPAHVIIDDADTKTITPQPHLELPAGHHKLTLVTVDGARKRTIGFNVEPGQTTTLTLHLSP
jgi:hypothetical protein